MFKDNPLFNLIKYTWRYSPNRKKFVLFMFMFLCANSFVLFEPIIISRVFNSIQFQNDDPNLLRFIIINLSYIFLLTLGFWLFHGVARVMENRHAYYVRKNYSVEMFRRVIELPASWHKANHSGDTIDKINKSSKALFEFSRSMFMIFETMIRLIFSMLILLFFDWKAIVLVMFFSAIIVLVVLKFDKYLIKGYKKVFKEENYLASGIHDYISNIITIITLRLKEKALKEIDDRSLRAYPQYKKNVLISEFKWALVSLFVSLMTVVILIVNAYSSYKTNGVIIIGTLFILYRYLSTIGRSFFNFTFQYGMLVERNSALKASEVLEESYEKNISKQKKYSSPVNWKEIEIKNLNFSYKEKSKKDIKKNNIHDVNIKIKRGQRIALVGESGSGKSTLLSLFRGLHEEDSVSINIDGKKINNGLANFYQSMALIPQDPEIFNTSIEDNIKMGRKFKKEDMERAVELAQFTRVVKRLKNGYKSNVMEKGVSLSGGEKQRLALSRGLLVADEYDFLLLDEPTSSVDSENELLIYQNIFENFKEKTIISSIHRLHLLKDFDYIYIFKQGEVITEGKFSEIVEDDNFKELWEKYTKHYEGD